jgi:hypothetical protein
VPGNIWKAAGLPHIPTQVALIQSPTTAARRDTAITNPSHLFSLASFQNSVISKWRGAEAIHEESRPKLASGRSTMSDNANDNSNEFSDDLLRGASEISQFMFGSSAFRRRVYHLRATSTLPIVSIGSMLCMRKSAFFEWLEVREQRARPANDNAKPVEKNVKYGKL